MKQLQEHVATKWPHNTDAISTVSEIVHQPQQGRLAQHELISFDKMMEAADATVESIFQSRKRLKRDAQNLQDILERPKLQSPIGVGDEGVEDPKGHEGCVGNDAAIARALIRTIVATTGVQMPDSFKTPHDAIFWASESIIGARSKAISSTRRERYIHTLDPEQVLKAMELIHKLSSMLDGAPDAK